MAKPINPWSRWKITRFHILHWFQKKIKVLELQLVFIVNKWDISLIVAPLLMIS
jgi:hypothetical protein